MVVAGLTGCSKKAEYPSATSAAPTQKAIQSSFSGGNPTQDKADKAKEKP